MIKKYNVKNQKGIALLTVCIFASILITFLIALLTMTINDTKLSTLQKESTRAFYLAETGIDMALWYLNTAVEHGGENKFTWRPVDYPLNPVSNTEYYQFTIKDIGVYNPTATPPTHETDKIKITSVGTVKKGKYSAGTRTVVVTAKIGISPLSSLSYNYAIFTDSIITLIKNLTVNGNIHANGDIDGSAKLPTVNGEQTIGGNEDCPKVDFEWYEEMISKGELDGIYYGDDTTKIFNVDDTISGIHFIDGDVEIPANVKLIISDGTILATGKIRSFGNAEITHTRSENYTNPLALIAKGDIVLRGTVLVEGIIQGGQDIVLGGTVDIAGGALFANNIRINGDVVITYDPNLLGEVVIGTGVEVYIKTSWIEGSRKEGKGVQASQVHKIKKRMTS